MDLARLAVSALGYASGRDRVQKQHARLPRRHLVRGRGRVGVRVRVRGRGRVRGWGRHLPGVG